MNYNAMNIVGREMMMGQSIEAKRAIVNGFVPRGVAVKQVDEPVGGTLEPLACEQQTHVRSTAVVAKVESTNSESSSLSLCVCVCVCRYLDRGILFMSAS